MGEGISYVSDRGEHLTNDQDQKKGEGKVLCSNEARVEDEVEGRKWGCNLDRCNDEQK